MAQITFSGKKQMEGKKNPLLGLMIHPTIFPQIMQPSNIFISYFVYKHSNLSLQNSLKTSNSCNGSGVLAIIGGKHTTFRVVDISDNGGHSFKLFSLGMKEITQVDRGENSY